MLDSVFGYCLCSGRRRPKIGEQWCHNPADVWVLPNMAAAKKIASKCDEWHEICEVCGYVNVTKRGPSGTIWTDEPQRLFITEIHPQYVPPQPTQEDIYAQAEYVLTRMKEIGI